MYTLELTDFILTGKGIEINTEHHGLTKRNPRETVTSHHDLLPSNRHPVNG